MEKTNLSILDKYTADKYPKEGVVYENTDETGFMETMVVANGGVWNQPKALSDAIRDSIKEEIMQELKAEKTELPMVELTSETNDNKVTEDFALRMAAIVMNKEKFNETK